MKSLSSDEKERWEDLVSRTHTKQCIWWLNGFWKELEKDADTLWDMVHVMIEIECGKAKRYGKLKWEEKEGSDLDQFQAHRFLEKMGETCTVKELRAKVANLDLDRNKRLAISEYLADKYKKNIKKIIDAPQGGQAAQEQLDKATKAVETAVAGLNTAVDEDNNAKIALEEAKKAKNESDKAQKEVEEAVNAVESQEAERNSKIEKLKNKIQNKDKKLSAMKVATCKNELAQVEGEDPLPLRKAKITQTAALKKSKKASKACIKEQKKAEVAVQAAKKAKEEAEALCKEAKDALRELKEKGDGVAHGQIWWMEKELAERQKYMPKGR